MDLIAPLEFSEFFLNFVVALGIGALIGLEREHRRDHTQVIAGVRTFPLFSVAGYMLAIVAASAGEGQSTLVAAGVIGIVAIAIAFLWVRHQLGITGLTTPMAMIVTFLVGLLIGYGFVQEAIVVGVATTFLLLTKQRLHHFAEVLNDEELMGALQFLTILFILFPFVRDLHAPVFGQEWIGRGQLVDPYFTLLVVIFVSSISFVSFAAMRVVGARRGVAVSGLLGGLVNSEATSVSLAEHANESPDLVRPAVMGALLATTTAFVRNLAIASFADPSLTIARLMLPALAPMMAVAAFFAYLKYRSVKRAAEKSGETRAPRIRNPFALLPAVKFALLFLGVSILADVAQRTLGPVGVYATAIGAVVSAGAVVASVAALYAHGSVTLPVAVVTCVFASVIGVANKLYILRATNTDVFHRSRRAFVVITTVGVLALAGLFLALRGA